MADHSFGCACARHVARDWNRPEHWTKADVAYLETRFGRITDEAIARKLGRTVVAIRLKAKRLGLLKRDAGMSSRDVGRLLGVDETTVSKIWIRRGLLAARRGHAVGGGRRVYLIADEAVEAFITRHGQWLDPDRVPDDSPFKAAAMATRWISLTELVERTGHGRKYLLWFIVGGVLPAARRGPHWYVRADHAWKVPARSPEAIADARFRREQTLDRRNARRKGLPAPAPGRSAVPAVLKAAS